MIELGRLADQAESGIVDDVLRLQRSGGEFRLDPSGGVGLASMRERATAAGGTLAIKSGGTGTLVRMTVPVRTPGGGERCPSTC